MQLLEDRTGQTGMKMVTIIKPLGNRHRPKGHSKAFAVFSITEGLLDQILSVKSLLCRAIWLSFMLSKSFLWKKDLLGM